MKSAFEAATVTNEGEQGEDDGKGKGKEKDKDKASDSCFRALTCCACSANAVEEYHEAQRALLESYQEMDKLALTVVWVEGDPTSEGGKGERGGHSENLSVSGRSRSESESQASEGSSSNSENRNLIAIAINVSFFCNVALLVIKLAAAISSASIAVVASTVDSGLDIAAGLIIFLTQKVVRRKSPYKYPQGKARLEPIGVIIFACVMGFSMLGLLQEAIAIIVKRLDGTAVSDSVNIDKMTTGILIANVLLKFSLYIFCRHVQAKSGNSMVEAYADDHRNDVLSNILVLISALLAANFSRLWFLDPTFAICLCIFIICNWYGTAKEQIRKLSGRAAGPEFLSKITYLAWNHDARVEVIDTVRAYHFGEKFLVELDIVLPKTMLLKEAHDIGQALQDKIETIDEVERAFVHLDYEWDHKPEHGNPYAADD
jgi:cation diffusion facilitator family transporter